MLDHLLSSKDALGSTMSKSGACGDVVDVVPRSFNLMQVVSTQRSSGLPGCLQEWAQTFCSSKPDEASKLFATAVLLGSTSAQKAVSALLYAQNTIGCLEGSTILDILSPPMSSEWAAGFQLCAVVTAAASNGCM